MSLNSSPKSSPLRNPLFRHPKTERLINTLKLIANRQGIDNARKHLVKHSDEKELRQFEWSLQDLAAMGINPVTIPRREKVKRIPGLLERYNEKINEHFKTFS